MTDIIERLRSPEAFITYGQMISPVALEAAAEIELLRIENIMYSNKYWNIAKEFDIMRRGLGCIADSDDVSVPNYVRQFARVLLGDINE